MHFMMPDGDVQYWEDPKRPERLQAMREDRLLPSSDLAYDDHGHKHASLVIASRTAGREQSILARGLKSLRSIWIFPLLRVSFIRGRQRLCFKDMIQAARWSCVLPIRNLMGKEESSAASRMRGTRAKVKLTKGVYLHALTDDSITTPVRSVFGTCSASARKSCCDRRNPAVCSCHARWSAGLAKRTKRSAGAPPSPPWKTFVCAGSMHAAPQTLPLEK